MALERLLLLRVRRKIPERLIPPVGVARNDAQQIFLTVTAHHHRRDQLRARLAVRAGDLVMLALVARRRVTPHRADQLDRFRELRDARPRRGIRYSVRAVLLFVPAGADAENEAATGQ